MKSAAESVGFTTVSEYVRYLHREGLKAGTERGKQTNGWARPDLFRRVGRDGVIYHGDSRGLLSDPKRLVSGSVDLIFTSPPFGLVRKKSYGNEDADQYVDWFRPFAAGFRRVLKESGSLVIDIGGVWKPGSPTRSLYHFELLLTLCREFGFHLCEEHYWWNPSKLPTPAEWVNVRRIRVKDAVNCLWWLSPSPWPRADNRRVLAPYSRAMQGLLKHGYKAKLRPSGHDISKKFQKNNGGAVPPNLLAVANTESNSRYQAYCRDRGLPIHPARFPALLAEYFVRMLTDENDLVVDPFAGSCVTGEVCRRLNRRWRCCELEKDFLLGAVARFEDEKDEKPRKAVGDKWYRVHLPCLLDNPNAPQTLGDGRKRPPRDKTDSARCS